MLACIGVSTGGSSELQTGGLKYLVSEQCTRATKSAGRHRRTEGSLTRNLIPPRIPPSLPALPPMIFCMVPEVHAAQLDRHVLMYELKGMEYLGAMQKLAM